MLQKTDGYLLSLGSADRTQAICSSLIAQAFQSIYMEQTISPPHLQLASVSYEYCVILSAGEIPVVNAAPHSASSPVAPYASEPNNYSG